MKVRSLVVGSSSLVAAVALALAGCGGGSSGGGAPKFSGSAKQAAAATITSAGSTGPSSSPVYGGVMMSSMMGGSLMSTVSGSIPKLTTVAPAKLSSGEKKIYSARAQVTNAFAQQLAPVYGTAPASGTTNIDQALTCAGGGSGSVKGTITNSATSSSSDLTLLANHCLSAVDTSGYSTELNGTVHVTTNSSATGMAVTLKTGKHAGGSSAWTMTQFYTAPSVAPVTAYADNSDMTLSVTMTPPDGSSARPHMTSVYALSGSIGGGYYDHSTGAQVFGYETTGTGFSMQTDQYVPTPTSSIYNTVTTLKGGMAMAFTDYNTPANSSTFSETFHNLVDSRSYDSLVSSNIITWTLNGSYEMTLTPDVCGGSGSMTISTVTPVVYDTSAMSIAYSAGEMTINGASVVFDGSGITVDGATYASLADLSAGDCAINVGL